MNKDQVLFQFKNHRHLLLCFRHHLHRRSIYFSFSSHSTYPMTTLILNVFDFLIYHRQISVFLFGNLCFPKSAQFLPTSWRLILPTLWNLRLHLYCFWLKFHKISYHQFLCTISPQQPSWLFACLLPPNQLYCLTPKMESTLDSQINSWTRNGTSSWQDAQSSMEL